MELNEWLVAGMFACVAVLAAAVAVLAGTCARLARAAGEQNRDTQDKLMAFHEIGCEYYQFRLDTEKAQAGASRPAFGEPSPKPRQNVPVTDPPMDFERGAYGGVKREEE